MTFELILREITFIMLFNLVVSAAAANWILKFCSQDCSQINTGNPGDLVCMFVLHLPWAIKLKYIYTTLTKAIMINLWCKILLCILTSILDHLRKPLKVLISIRVPLDIQSINQSNQMYFPAIIIQVTWVYLHDILLKVCKV